jgi:hypothetical protein
MPNKAVNNHAIVCRPPKQECARHKMGLIFEAMMRLFDDVDVSALTDQCDRRHGGHQHRHAVSVFDDKDAILYALSNRELQVLASKVMAAMDQVVPRPPEERIRLLVGAVFESYGRVMRCDRATFTIDSRGF